MLLSRLALDRGRGLRMLVFLGNFTLAKAAIYLIPLGIAAVAPGETYGAIELAQSIGLLAVALTIGAPLSGFTQQYLVRNDRSGGAAIALASFAGCLSALAAYLVAVLLGAAPVVQLVLASLAAAVVHNLTSTCFRTFNWRNFTAWGDGCAMLIAGVVAGVLVLTGAASVENVARGYALIALLGCLGTGWWLWRGDRTQLVAQLVTLTRVGLPMIVVAALATWLGVGGRIVVGFLNASALPEFGVAFRVAGLALGIHQLFTTALFARVYAARTRQADAVLGWFFLAVALLLIAISVVGRWLPDVVTFSALDAGSAQAYRTILPLAALQVFFWIGYAMTQVRINRSRLAGRAIIPTLVVTLGGMALVFAIGIFVTADIVILSWLIAAHAALFFFTNVWLLARRGIPHRRLALIGAVGGAVLCLIAAGLQFAA